MALFFFGAGIVLFVAAVHHWLVDHRYATSGVVAVASVTRTEVLGPRGHHHGRTLVVSYEYQSSDGQTHKGTAELSETNWRTLRGGDELPIEYLANAPDQSEPIELHGAFSPMFAGLTALLLIAASLCLSGRILYRVERTVRLVRDGVPALGCVTKVSTVKKAFSKAPIFSWEWRTMYTVEYAYADIQRNEYCGTIPIMFWTARWQTGDPVLVLYNRAQPARSEVDVFESRPHDLEALLSGTEQKPGQ